MVVRAVINLTNRKVARPVAFSVITYLEDNNWGEHFRKCLHDGYPYAYCIHDRDTKEDGTPDKPHCQSLIRIPNGKTVSAFAKAFNLKENLCQGLSSYVSYAVYLVHADFDSQVAGKFRYDSDEVKGSLREEIIRIIDNSRDIRQAKSKEDDSNIITILNYIESCEYLSVSDLVRWCCASGLYSVFRRAGNIVMSCLREHNKVHYKESPEYYLSKQVETLKSLSDSLLHLTEGLYGDMWERQKNPFAYDRFARAYEDLAVAVHGKIDCISPSEAKLSREKLKNSLAEIQGIA